MTRVVAENYAYAAEKVATGAWRVDTVAGVIYGVSGRPFVRRNTSGYVQIKFRNPSRPGTDVAVLAHRVIWEAAHGPIAPGLQINHQNGVKHDNRLENLELVTALENVRHALRSGLTVQPKGDESATAKLASADAVEIYRRAWAGESREAIAQDYPVGASQVTNIQYGLAWGHATGHKRPLTEAA